jgi:hypothetical protein
MMNALLLFVSQFALVTLLVVQSQNNTHGHGTLAFFTSIAIGITQLAAFRLMPNADALEMVAFVAGGPFGNVLAQWIKRHDIARIRALRGD